MCSGSEHSLRDCRYTEHDNCGAGEGAGVECRDTEHEQDRLAASTTTVKTTTEAPSYPTGGTLVYSCALAL